MIQLTLIYIFRGKFLLLENISCKIKEGCTGHLPWPKGICSKCQPSAITLNRQVNKINKLLITILLIYTTVFNFNRPIGMLTMSCLKTQS